VLGYEEPIRCGANVARYLQTAVCEVDVCKALLAIPPRCYGALDVAEHRRSDRPAVSRRQQRQHVRLATSQVMQSARPFARNEDCARTEHETLRRERHDRLNWDSALARMPSVT